MPQRWMGSLVTLLILGGVVLILLLNLNLPGRNPRGPRVPELASPVESSTSTTPERPDAEVRQRPADFREYPIGEEVEKNHIRIAAVWLPMVQMEGMASPGSSAIIHIEADIHATAGNPNGFAKDEFVPYLKVHYTITPRDAPKKSDEAVRGPLIPMVARDGLHYGASIEMPRAGRYTLTYRIEPPSAGGLGRHSDAVTGVAPWWPLFEVAFDWDYPGPPR